MIKISETIIEVISIISRITLCLPGTIAIRNVLLFLRKSTPTTILVIYVQFCQKQIKYLLEMRHLKPI